MSGVLRRTSILLLVGSELAVIALLHRLGAEPWLRVDWSDLDGWLRHARPEDALAAAVRAVALALAYWVLTTTVLYLTARLMRAGAALRGVEWATIPAVRRVVDGAVAVSIATASIAGPAAPGVAQVPTPVVVEIDDEGRPMPPGVATTVDDDAASSPLPPGPIPPGLDRVGWAPTPAGMAPTGTAPAVDAAGTRPHPSTASVVVEPGDNLWVISARHLERVTGTSVDGGTIVRYWRRVVDANRDRLRSGDPDLIYPGESVLLPPRESEGS
jgi:hypothetical protein